LTYFEEELGAYEAYPDAAKAYLATGTFQLPESVPTEDIAAYTIIANTIFNLDEAITRG